MKKKGFTLVEIMIVVAIIGILVTIAVPGFIKARRTSQGKACSENLTKIDGAVENWALDENQGTGDTCTISGDLVQANGTGYLKHSPECPSGGTYTDSQTVGTEPTCDSADIDYTKGLHCLPGQTAP